MDVSQSTWQRSHVRARAGNRQEQQLKVLIRRLNGLIIKAGEVRGLIARVPLALAGVLSRFQEFKN
jgi:hypothetical protein